MKITLEKRLQQSLLQLGGEKNDEINQLQQRVEELQQHIENLCQQHEEVLLRAENDKQQALLIGALHFYFYLNFYYYFFFFDRKTHERYFLRYCRSPS